MNRTFILLVSSAASALWGCSVQFDDFVYDQDAFEQEQSNTDSNVSEFCREFCDDSASFCEFGTSLGYQNESDCLNACAGFDDEELECRIVEVGKAENAPEDHCPATLIDGGGICSDASPDPCDDFCAESETVCVFGSSVGYESREDCLAFCGTLASEDLNCRVVHLGFAARSQESRPEHCPHTLKDGGGVCSDETK